MPLREADHRATGQSLQQSACGTTIFRDGKIVYAVSLCVNSQFFMIDYHKYSLFGFHGQPGAAGMQGRKPRINLARCAVRSRTE